MRERRRNNRRRNVILSIAAATLFIAGMFFLWMASLRIPALEDLADRKVIASTRIYDRTGEVLLYDVSQDVRRTIVAFDDISPLVKQATIAIEDKDFYNHRGIKLSSFMRALLVNISTMSFSQGGSTITQQVVKNSILTKDKTPTRKLKEWILAEKLEKVLTKDEILNFYLNEIPYGGNIYGIEEASRAFFGKSARDLTLVESAYLAALPKAPSYFSPYGRNRQALEDRKNLVLREMKNLGYITEEEYEAALKEEVAFKPRAHTSSIKAPHFVFFVIDYMTQRYGEDAVRNGGFKVVTSLDYRIQEDAEVIAKKYGEINTRQFNGKNNAFVAMDPRTGEILAMVGSRNYFDDDIEGNFNVATAHRQPGSAIKPIVYAAAFNKGYTPETILFDVQTQFSAVCAPDNFTSQNNCYSPGNYDNRFRGPMTIREALAQSTNVPAVKALYLAGIRYSIEVAKSMGIESLNDPARYGLTLVLGGGEVSLLDMTAAYSVFANDGVRNPYTPIIRIEDANGNILERYTSFPKRVLPEQTARSISSILSDNVARTPLYGANSVLHFPGRDVAVKTGTTNDYRDAWIIGYTPNLVIGTWAGNNDNSSMERRVSGLIVAPMWRELMEKTLPRLATETFPRPEPVDMALKPVLRGEWRGGSSRVATDGSGRIGEEYVGGIHTILYWVNKDDPRGPAPSRPESDPQFRNWEYSVRRWAAASGYSDSSIFVPTYTPPPAQPTQPIPNDPYNPYNPYYPGVPQEPQQPQEPQPVTPIDPILY